MNLVSKVTAGLIISGILTSLFTWATTQTISDTIEMTLGDIAVYDPYCDNEENIVSDYCNPKNNFHLGTSININDNSLNRANILAILIDIREVPRSNAFSTTDISKAHVELKILKEQNKEFPLIMLNGYCSYIGIERIYDGFPCIDSAKQMKAESIEFNTIEKNEFDKITIDVKSHILKAKNSGQNHFVEMIQVMPADLWRNKQLSDISVDCISNAQEVSQKAECIESQRIMVYDKNSNEVWLQPQLAISYSLKPTTLTQILITSAAAVIPVIAAVYKVWLESDKKRKDENAKKEKRIKTICDTLEQEVLAIKAGFNKEESLYNESYSVVNPGKNDEYLLDIKLKMPISFIHSPTYAFQGIINSGSFGEFNKETQTKVSELYDMVRSYENILDSTEQIIQEIVSQYNASDIEAKKKSFQMIIKNNFAYLGDMRKSILDIIDKEIIDVISKEKSKHSGEVKKSGKSSG